MVFAKSEFAEVMKMKLDGFGFFVNDMPTMVRFYRDFLGFEITEGENAVNVYLIKDGTLFMLYARKNFEKMTGRKYDYLKGFNGHFEIALKEPAIFQPQKETRLKLVPLTSHLIAEFQCEFLVLRRD